MIPGWISRWLQQKLFNEELGDTPSELVPDHDIGAGNPVVNDDLLRRVREGLIVPHRSEVAEFTDIGVNLADGTHIEADVVIACTGYQVFLPVIPLYFGKLPDD